MPAERTDGVYEREFNEGYNSIFTAIKEKRLHSDKESLEQALRKEKLEKKDSPRGAGRRKALAELLKSAQQRST